MWFKRFIDKWADRFNPITLIPVDLSPEIDFLDKIKANEDKYYSTKKLSFEKDWYTITYPYSELSYGSTTTITLPANYTIVYSVSDNNMIVVDTETSND